MLDPDNILGTNYGNILESTADYLLGSALRTGDRNTSCLVGVNGLGYPIFSFDGSGLLDGKELG